MAARIFVSYRRDDSAGHAGRLVSDLRQRFGADAVFHDIGSIEPGMDWEQALEKGVGNCAVLLAVIGRDWADARNEQGQRRIDDPRDHLRREIATALRIGTRVIPVLVNGAKPPSETVMPDDLDPLAKRQAHEITDSRWDYDVEQLVRVLAKLPDLKRLPQAEPAASAGKGGMRRWLGVAVGVLAVLWVLGSMVSTDAPEPRLPPSPMPAPTAERDPGRDREAAARPAPQPQPEAAPVAPVASAAVPATPAPAAIDLSGRWTDQDGFIYVVRQQGNALSYQVIDPDDRSIAGTGSGQTDGQRVVAVTNYGGLSRWQSELVLAPDGRSMRGYSVDLDNPVRESIALHR